MELCDGASQALPTPAAPAERHGDMRPFHHCCTQSWIALPGGGGGPKEGPMPWGHSPGVLDQGMPEPTDPLAVMHRGILVPCIAQPHHIPGAGMSPSPAGHKVSSWGQQKLLLVFPWGLALQSSGTASAGRGAAGAAGVCLETLLQVSLKALFNPYMPNSF